MSAGTVVDPVMDSPQIGIGIPPKIQVACVVDTIPESSNKADGSELALNKLRDEARIECRRMMREQTEARLRRKEQPKPQCHFDTRSRRATARAHDYTKAVVSSLPNPIVDFRNPSCISELISSPKSCILNRGQNARITPESSMPRREDSIESLGARTRSQTSLASPSTFGQYSPFSDVEPMQHSARLVYPMESDAEPRHEHDQILHESSHHQRSHASERIPKDSSHSHESASPAATIRPAQCEASSSKEAITTDSTHDVEEPSFSNHATLKAATIRPSRCEALRGQDLFTPELRRVTEESPSHDAASPATTIFVSKDEATRSQDSFMTELNSVAEEGSSSCYEDSPAAAICSARFETSRSQDSITPIKVQISDVALLGPITSKPAPRVGSVYEATCSQDAFTPATSNRSFYEASSSRHAPAPIQVRVCEASANSSQVTTPVIGVHVSSARSHGHEVPVTRSRSLASSDFSKFTKKHQAPRDSTPNYFRFPGQEALRECEEDRHRQSQVQNRRIRGPVVPPDHNCLIDTSFHSETLTKTSQASSRNQPSGHAHAATHRITRSHSYAGSKSMAWTERTAASSPSLDEYRDVRCARKSNSSYHGSPRYPRTLVQRPAVPREARGEKPKAETSAVNSIRVYKNGDLAGKNARIDVYGKSMAEILKKSTRVLSAHDYFLVRRLYDKELTEIRSVDELIEGERYIATLDGNLPDLRSSMRFWAEVLIERDSRAMG